MADDLEIRLTAHDELTPQLEKNAKAVDKLKAKTDGLSKAEEDLSQTSTRLSKVKGLLKAEIGGAAAAYLSWTAVIHAAVKVIETYRDAAEKAARVDFSNALDSIAEKAEIAEKRIERLAKAMDLAAKARDAMNSERSRHADTMRSLRRQMEEAGWRSDIANAATPEKRAELERRFSEWSFNADREDANAKHSARVKGIRTEMGDVQKRLELNAQADAAEKRRISRASQVRDDVASMQNDADPGVLRKYLWSVRSLFGFDYESAAQGGKGLQDLLERASAEVDKGYANRERLLAEKKELEARAKLLREQAFAADSEHRAALEVIDAKRELAKALEEERKSAERDAEDRRKAEDARREGERKVKEAENNLRNAIADQAKTAKQSAADEEQAKGRLAEAKDRLGALNDEAGGMSIGGAKAEANAALKADRKAEADKRKRDRESAAYEKEIERIRKKAEWGKNVGVGLKNGAFGLTAQEAKMLELHDKRQKDIQQAKADAAKAAADLKAAQQAQIDAATAAKAMEDILSGKNPKAISVTMPGLQAQ